MENIKRTPSGEAADEVLNVSYIGVRGDVAELVPSECDKILDVGCSIGSLGENIKKKRKVHITGIEVDRKMAEIAATVLDRVIEADVEKLDFDGTFGDERFNCAIFADVLEHLVNPWLILRKSTDLISPDGYVIISLPNIRHYSTLIDLIFRGVWSYRDRGIHDRTHLRFFTLKTIRTLLEQADLKIVKIRRHYRIIEKVSRFNKISRFFAIPILRDFLTFQFLILAKRK